MLDEKKDVFLANFGTTQNLNNELLNAQLPNSRNEFWKYTRLNNLFKSTFTEPANLNTPEGLVDGLTLDNAYTLIFKNGLYQPTNNAIDGVEIVVNDIKSTESGPFEDQFFNAVNQQYASKSVTINITKSIGKTLQIIDLYANDGSYGFLNLSVNVAQSVESNLYHTVNFNGTKNNFIAPLIQCSLAENSSLVLHQNCNAETNSSIQNVIVKQQRSSNFKSLFMLSGGTVNRCNVNTYLQGENANATINCIMGGTTTDHLDFHTFIDHQVPHCESSETIRSLFTDNATGVFNGKIMVRRDAQKTNAYQSSKGVLLSDNATMFAKPELEIYADDVKCSHGSTTGQLEEEALFYLQSRGIGLLQAKKLLSIAFLNDLLEEVTVEEIKLDMEASLDKLLSKIFD